MTLWTTTHPPDPLTHAPLFSLTMCSPTLNTLSLTSHHSPSSPTHPLIQLTHSR